MSAEVRICLSAEKLQMSCNSSEIFNQHGFSSPRISIGIFSANRKKNAFIFFIIEFIRFPLFDKNHQNVQISGKVTTGTTG